MAVSSRMQTDLLEAAAVVPVMRAAHRRAARRACVLRLRLDGADLSKLELDVDGVADGRRQRRRDSRSARVCRPTAADPDAQRISRPSRSSRATPPEIRAEAEIAVRGVTGDSRARRAAHALRQRAAREEADRQPAVGARGAAHEGRRLQRAHGALRRDGARARASRPGSRSASCTCAARSTTTRGPRCTSTRGAGAACGCRSIRRSTSFPPTRRTCGSPAAASTSRRRSCR